MTPTLDFLERNPSMLAEMVADFQQRKKIVDMAKTKEPVDANFIENPNLRAFIPYPKMMYNHRNRTTQPANNEREQQQLMEAGWKAEPWVGPTDPGVPIGPVTASDPMADERMDGLERRMLSLEEGMAEILNLLQQKRGPGRPPKTHED